MLSSWQHSIFSIESDTRLFHKADREGLGHYVVSGAACTEKIHYDPDNDMVTWTASPKGYYTGRIETFKGFEVVAIIEDPSELAKIIEWAEEKEKEPPLSVCAPSPPQLAWVPNKPLQSVVIRKRICPA